MFTLNNFSDNFLIKWQIPHSSRSASELAFLGTGKDQELLILPMNVSSLIVLMELEYVRKVQKLLVGTYSDLAKYKKKPVLKTTSDRALYGVEGKCVCALFYSRRHHS